MSTANKGNYMGPGIIRHLQSEQGEGEGALPPLTIIAVDGEIFRSSAAYGGLVLRGLRDVLGQETSERFALRVLPPTPAPFPWAPTCPLFPGLLCVR